MSGTTWITEPDLKTHASAPQVRNAKGPSIGSPQGSVSALQRTIGNRAVQRLFKSGALQAKLKISRPGDAYEAEADRIAEEVMRMTEPVGKQWKTPSEGQVTGKGISSGGSEWRYIPMDRGGLRRKALPYDNDGASGIKGANEAVRGTGEPLSEPLRSYFEPRFGYYDFGGVRVHTGAKAAESARAVNARAFTIGRDVVFGEGEYAPDTGDGKRLLAHELTHVVQQESGGSQDESIQTSAISAHLLQRDVLGGIAEAATSIFTTLTSPRYIQIISDILDSIKEATLHAPEILGEVWESIKEHWIAFTATLIGFIIAEEIVAVLAAAPEPTMITKIVAIALQVLMIAVLGYFAAVEIKGALEEGINWFTRAYEANGDSKKISEASRSFCRMVLHIALAILAIIGVRAKVRGFRVPAGAPREVPGEFSKGAPKEKPGTAKPSRLRLNLQEMANFLNKIWTENSILRRLHEIKDLSGTALRQAIMETLGEFEAQTGIRVRFVPEGTVQAARGKGNFASLRSRPGYLEIEEQLIKNPDLWNKGALWTEIAHEIAAYYVGLLEKSVPSLGESPVDAIILMDEMLKAGPEKFFEHFGVRPSEAGPSITPPKPRAHAVPFLPPELKKESE